MGVKYISFADDDYWSSINGLWAYLDKYGKSIEEIIIVVLEEDLDDFEKDLRLILNSYEVKADISKQRIEDISLEIDDPKGSWIIDISGASKGSAVKMLLDIGANKFENVFSLDVNGDSNKPYPMIDSSKVTFKDIREEES